MRRKREKQRRNVGGLIWGHSKLPGGQTFHRCCYCQKPTSPLSESWAGSHRFYEVLLNLPFGRLTKAAVASSFYMSSVAKVRFFLHIPTHFWKISYYGLIFYFVCGFDILLILHCFELLFYFIPFHLNCWTDGEFLCLPLHGIAIQPILHVSIQV